MPQPSTQSMSPNYLILAPLLRSLALSGQSEITTFQKVPLRPRLRITTLQKARLCWRLRITALQKVPLPEGEGYRVRATDHPIGLTTSRSSITALHSVPSTQHFFDLSPITHHSLPVTHHSLPVTHHLSLIAFNSSLITHHSSLKIP
jgi:hypothetical protein